MTNTARVSARKSTLERMQNRYGYVFISIWIVGLFMFTIFPMLFSLVLSLCRWDIVTGLSTIEFIGFQNFGKIFTDRKFWTALKVTFTFCAVSIPLYQISSLGIAMLLNLRIRFMRGFRLMFYLPSIIPTIASSMIWMQILNEDGILNRALRVFGIHGPAWLRNPSTALYALVIMGIWGIGQTMIIYLSGLQGVAAELHEAAEIDGATSPQRFLFVTLPLLSPTIFFNVVMAVIGSFQYFTQAYIMTDGTGGPLNSTLFYNLYLYIKAYKEFKMGYASALAWILFILIMAFTLLTIKSSSFWVYYQNDDKL